MYTLGINAAYHDSSACLVRDGIALAAAEEERFTGVKHAKRPVPFSAYELPFHAIDYCLSFAGINLVQVDHVAYSYDPSLFPGFDPAMPGIELPVRPSDGQSSGPGHSVWDPLFCSYIVNAARQLSGGAPHHLRKRFLGAGTDGPYQWHYVPHHLAHAASAFLVSPHDEAAVMTIDGRGERATTSYGFGKGTVIELFAGVNMPNSLGLLYEQLTSHLGFLHSSDEYKVMALASYGKPRWKKQFEELITIGENGDYRIRPVDLEQIFGPARQRGGRLEERHYDIACSLQAVLEETVLQLAQWLWRKTNSHALCLAGGVALNCVMNAALRDRGPFRHIWIQPAAGDSGTALGAAMYIDNRERGAVESKFRMEHACLGPSYTDSEIELLLREAKLPYRRMTDIAGETAELLMKDAVVGWFQGRMEFGPRALGARSILASPVHAEMKETLNAIKDREDFRPVAPVVLEEEASRWFEGAGRSPFMLFVYKVLEQKREHIPAVCHEDGTARIQTINREQNPLYYDVVSAFYKRSGVPVLVNTSFNTRGKPIVCSPRDAIECFYTSPLDALAIGSFLLQKPGV